MLDQRQQHEKETLTNVFSVIRERDALKNVFFSTRTVKHLELGMELLLGISWGEEGFSCV